MYIHDVLNTSHGDLKCDNVHISEDGEVKIGNSLRKRIRTITFANASVGNIGESLIRLGNNGDSARDVEAVYKIAATLLGTSSSSSIVNVSELMADHFTNLPNDISPRDVLKVRRLATPLRLHGSNDWIAPFFPNQPRFLVSIAPWGDTLVRCPYAPDEAGQP
jgi:hypothetical protein